MQHILLALHISCCLQFLKQRLRECRLLTASVRGGSIQVSIFLYHMFSSFRHTHLQVGFGVRFLHARVVMYAGFCSVLYYANPPPRYPMHRIAECRQPSSSSPTLYRSRVMAVVKRTKVMAFHPARPARLCFVPCRSFCRSCMHAFMHIEFLPLLPVCEPSFYSSASILCLKPAYADCSHQLIIQPE